MFNVNTLFDVTVTTKGNDHIYSLYKAGDDVPVYEEIGGSAWMSSPEGMIQMGNHLAYKYCQKKGLSLRYAVGISYRDWFEVKWWYEKEARDTVEQFTHQLNRPELWATKPFEFLTPMAETRQIVLQTLALRRYIYLTEQAPVIQEFDNV